MAPAGITVMCPPDAAGPTVWTEIKDKMVPKCVEWGVGRDDFGSGVGEWQLSFRLNTIGIYYGISHQMTAFASLVNLTHLQKISSY